MGWPPYVYLPYTHTHTHSEQNRAVPKQTGSIASQHLKLVPSGRSVRLLILRIFKDAVSNAEITQLEFILAYLTTFSLYSVEQEILRMANC